MKKKQKILLTVFLVIFLFYMLFQPDNTLIGSRNGLLLWFHTILPTLLPFLILSNLLLHTQILPHLLQPMKSFFSICFGLSPHGGYAFFIGLFCGYPMGAKITADLYREGRISLQEARYLLAVGNNPSPVFLITYVLYEQLHAKGNTGRLLLIFYGSLLATSVFFRLIMRKKPSPIPTEEIPHKKETSHPLPFGVLIDVSIMNSFETVTKLGGYIILCSIGVTALGCIPETLLPVRIFLGSILEISTGIHNLAALLSPGKTQLVYVLSAAAFGGLCILMQTYSVIRGTGLPISTYLKGKVVQTLLTASALLLFV